MSFVDRMIDRMLGKMSNEDKEEMMGRMMNKFLADMTKEDKQKTIDSAAERALGRRRSG